MPASNGSKKIAKIYYGSNEVAKGYYGGNLVFENEKNIIVNLGTGKTWNIKTLYPQLPWSKFTTNNFFITYGSASKTGSISGVLQGSCFVNMTYSGGSLTIDMTALANGSASTNGSVHAYLVTRPQDLVHLGEGQTFDVSNYEGYEDFTMDNFLIKSTTNGTIGTVSNTGSYTVSAGISKSYDSSTGILSCSFNGRITGGFGAQSSKNVDVYLRR